MFGHVADRAHSSRWLIPSFLFAIALAWSFAMLDRSESPVSLGTMLAVAVGVSGLRVGIMLIGGRRRRRERKAEHHANGDAAVTDGEGPAEEHRPTYEEIFGEPAGSDGPSDQLDPVDDGEDDADGELVAGDGDDGPSGELQGAHDDDSMAAEVEAAQAEIEGMGEQVETGDGEADWMSGEVEADHAEAEGMREQEERLDAEVEEPEADVEAIRSELESEEAIRRLREEFKTRAREAELRIQQRQGEFDPASSAPTSA